MQEIKCRIAPSLGGGFAGTPLQVWGTKTYNPKKDIDKPCVFFGLYGLPDFMTLRRHQGKRWILWCGSDIRHFLNGYWLDDKGEMKTDPKPLAKWINENCESWVENYVERDALLKVGILSNICPSFLGNVDKFKTSFKPSRNVELYTSVSGDDFELYGWDKIDDLAKDNKDITFHLYGNNKKWKSKQKNVIVHCRVSQQQMDKETKKMQGALRLTAFDGFSELLAKSILWGQYPVSTISYAGMFTTENIKLVKYMTKPNIRGQNYYKNLFNKFPWVNK